MNATFPASILHAKRAKLVQDQGKALADLNAVTGALQVVDQLIAEVEQSLPVKPTPSGGGG